MTTTLLWLAIIVLAIGIVRLAHVQQSMMKLVVTNAQVTAQLAKATSDALKAHSALFGAQEELNRAVLDAFRSRAGEGPHRTSKPDLRLVPRDEDATA